MPVQTFLKTFFFPADCVGVVLKYNSQEHRKVAFLRQAEQLLYPYYYIILLYPPMDHITPCIAIDLHTTFNRRNNDTMWPIVGNKCEED